MASEEQLVFDSLTLNDATFGLAELSCPPPRERPEWIGAADSEAQLLARTPLHENREITVRIQVAPQADMNTALDKVGQLVDKCLRASKYADGIALTWTPATSTRTVTFDVLSAEITDLPIDWQNGWLALAPSVTIAMKAKPYWRGTESLTSTTSSSTPFVTAELVNSSGDVPALGRLIVTDTATQSRRHVEWGLEGPLTYNSATSLLIDSDNMVTSGFAGAQAVGSGAYDPGASGNSAIRANPIYTSPVAVCGTGDLSHIGTFRVKARVQSSNARVRLTWQVGDGQVSSNQWVTLPIAGPWCEIDLGTITLPPVVTGTQRWKGTVEAYSTGSGYDLWVDYLVLVPTSDGYGKARAIAPTSQVGTAVAVDDFTGTTSGGALSGRVATLGGSWTTSGDATDFAFADDFSGEQITRTAVSGTSGRRALISSAQTDVTVQAKVYSSAFVGTGNAVTHGVLARYVDASNYLLGALEVATVSGAQRATLYIISKIAGTDATLAGFSYRDGLSAPLGAWYGLQLAVTSSGVAYLRLLDSTMTSTLALISGNSSALATGGTLDDGSVGLLDLKTGSAAATRYYDDFYASSTLSPPIVIYSGRNMQIRHDDTIRQDATGTYTGRPQSYRGSRLLVPVGTSRVLVKARRNDVDVASDENVVDATQIQVGVTPRGLAVPRS